MQQKTVTTTAPSPQRVDTAPPTPKPVPAPAAQLRFDMNDLSREIASLEAQLAEDRQAYARRPRILRLNAASTMQEALHERTASSIMTAGSVTLGPDMIAGEALAVLQERRISAAFVTEGKTPVGLITMLRLLNRGAA